MIDSTIVETRLRDACTGLQPTNGLATRFRQYGREEGRSRVRKSGSENLNSFRKIAFDSSIRRFYGEVFPVNIMTREVILM